MLNKLILYRNHHYYVTNPSFSVFEWVVYNKDNNPKSGTCGNEDKAYEDAEKYINKLRSQG